MQEISKYASIIYRNGQMYFDEKLAPYHIGCGQQFFLLRIHDNPGLNQYELAAQGMFDKGTTARAVKKLLELGYIRREIDEEDHRISKLYVSSKGEPFVVIIREMIKEWHLCLTSNLDEKEKDLVDQLMKKLADNASETMKKERKRDMYGTSDRKKD
ncbi:MAG: MarR family transcriptional regulator [Longicatena sp.]